MQCYGSCLSAYGFNVGILLALNDRRNRLKKALSLRSMSDADRQEHKKSLDRLMDELQQIK